MLAVKPALLNRCDSFASYAGGHATHEQLLKNVNEYIRNRCAALQRMEGVPSRYSGNIFFSPLTFRMCRFRYTLGAGIEGSGAIYLFAAKQNDS